MASPRISLLAAALLLSGTVAAQKNWTWGGDPAAACERAAKTDRLVVLLFTIGDPCRRCRALENRVFGDPAAAPRLARSFEAVRLMYGPGASTENEALELWAARAGLRGYPTLYVVDADGWPCFQQAGFKDDAKSARSLLSALDGVHKAKDQVDRQRKAGKKGLEKLFKWYGKRGMRLGEWRAARALYPQVEGAARAALVPVLVGSTIVEEGVEAGQAMLDLVAKHDPQSRRGWQAPALYAAANLHLRRCELEAACRGFHRLVALEKAPVMMRLEAEMGLGMAYRKRGDLGGAKRHYERCRKLALELGTGMGKAAAKQAERRLKQLGEAESGSQHDHDHDHDDCPNARRR